MTPIEQPFSCGRSSISVQHRNSQNHGPKTRFSCARGRTRKLRGSISSRKGLMKLKFSESLALNMQVEPANQLCMSMCHPNDLTTTLKP